MASTFKIYQQGKEIFNESTITYLITGNMPESGDIGIENNGGSTYETILTTYDDNFTYVHDSAPRRLFINLIYPSSTDPKTVEFNIGGIHGSDLREDTNDGFETASCGASGNNLIFSCTYLPNHGAEFIGTIKNCVIGETQYGDVIFAVTATFY